MSGFSSKTANSFDGSSSPQTSRSDDKNCWCSFVKIHHYYYCTTLLSSSNLIQWLLRHVRAAAEASNDASILTHHLHYVTLKKSQPFSSFVSAEASDWQADPPPTVFTPRPLPSSTGTSCCIAAQSSGCVFAACSS